MYQTISGSHKQNHLSTYALDQPTEHWDTLLINLSLNKLSSVLIEEREKSCKRKSLPTMTDFLQFLETKCHVLETLETHGPLVTSICKSNVSVGEVKEIV